MNFAVPRGRAYNSPVRTTPRPTVTAGDTTVAPAMLLMLGVVLCVVGLPFLIFPGPITSDATEFRAGCWAVLGLVSVLTGVTLAYRSHSDLMATTHAGRRALECVLAITVGLVCMRMAWFFVEYDTAQSTTPHQIRIRLGASVRTFFITSGVQGWLLWMVRKPRPPEHAQAAGKPRNRRRMDNFEQAVGNCERCNRQVTVWRAQEGVNSADSGNHRQDGAGYLFEWFMNPWRCAVCRSRRVSDIQDP